jgi:hypothetical protein
MLVHVPERQGLFRTVGKTRFFQLQLSILHPAAGDTASFDDLPYSRGELFDLLTPVEHTHNHWFAMDSEHNVGSMC